MAIDSKWLYEYVVKRFSSEQEMESFLPQPKTAAQLQAVSDDRYLSLISQRVFRAGLRHAMVDQRWPAFEEAFWGFEPKKMILLSGEHFERFMRNKELIRHLPKMKSIPINRSEEHTSELQSRPHLVCGLLLEKKNDLASGRGRETRCGLGSLARRRSPLS